MLLELTTPTFFVVGSDAVNCDVSRLDVSDDTALCVISRLTLMSMQELRERMKVENSMTVVNGADDQVHNVK